MLYKLLPIIRAVAPTSFCASTSAPASNNVDMANARLEIELEIELELELELELG